MVEKKVVAESDEWVQVGLVRGGVEGTLLSRGVRLNWPDSRFLTWARSKIRELLGALPRGAHGETSSRGKVGHDAKDEIKYVRGFSEPAWYLHIASLHQLEQHAA